MVPVAVLPAGVSDTRVQDPQPRPEQDPGRVGLRQSSTTSCGPSPSRSTPPPWSSRAYDLGDQDACDHGRPPRVADRRRGRRWGQRRRRRHPGARGDARRPRIFPALARAGVRLRGGGGRGRAALVQYGMGADPVSSGAALVAMARALQGGGAARSLEGVQGQEQEPRPRRLRRAVMRDGARILWSRASATVDGWPLTTGAFVSPSTPRRRGSTSTLGGRALEAVYAASLRGPAFVGNALAPLIPDDREVLARRRSKFSTAQTPWSRSTSRGGASGMGVDIKRGLPFDGP